MTLKEGQYLSIDGAMDIFTRAVETTDSEVKRVLQGQMAAKSSATELFETVMGWADKARRMKIRTNADTPAMAKAAIAFGAEGIGLCRTEHMFFEGTRIDYMPQMILAADLQQRGGIEKAVAVSRKDFKDCFVQ